MRSKRYKDSYLRLIMLMVISSTAGLHLLISPDTVNLWIIRGVGLVWVIEGIGHAMSIINKRLENKILNMLKRKR